MVIDAFIWSFEWFQIQIIKTLSELFVYIQFIYHLFSIELHRSIKENGKNVSCCMCARNRLRTCAPKNLQKCFSFDDASLCCFCEQLISAVCWRSLKWNVYFRHVIDEDMYIIKARFFLNKHSLPRFFKYHEMCT